jgi:hypothetical protein
MLLNATPVANVCVEADVLLCCARTSMDAVTVARLRALLEQKLDWSFLLKLAYQHEIVPLLYTNLSTTCPEAVPQQVLKQLQSYFQTNTCRNLFLSSELHKLLNLFELQGIASLPFKGVALAGSTYGNLAWREFADLDIFIQEEDVPTAIALLVSQGYQLPDQLLNVRQKPYLQFKQFLESPQCQRSYNLTHPERQVTVELHWSLSPRYFPFEVDFEHLWTDKQTVPIGGINIPHFATEDLLLFLCIHGSKHCWEQLKWICDVAQLLQTQQIDWQLVLEKANMQGAERMLFLGLLLARNLLQAELPNIIELRVQADLGAQSLAAQVREQFYCQQPLSTHHFRVRAMDRLRDKIHYYLHIATTPSVKEWEILPLPKSFSFVYCLMRPFRLMASGWQS